MSVDKNATDVTLIYGDGIGKEVVGATKKIIDASLVPKLIGMCAKLVPKSLSAVLPLV